MRCPKRLKKIDSEVTTATFSNSSAKPRSASSATAWGSKLRPAPIGRISGAASNTRAGIPRLCRHRARVSPPIPAPMISTSILGAPVGRRWTVGSGVAAILAPHADFLLHRTVGEAEQHALAVGLVHDGLPARHDEDVLRTPLQHGLADTRA